MERPVRLNLGAGDKYWPGYINIDKYGDQDSNIDLHCVSSFTEILADEIHAIHVFEHLPRLEIENYLNDWCEALKPGGLLCMEMPSFDKICQLHVNGEKNIRLTLLGVFGDPRDFKPGMLHQWCYGEDELRVLLKRCGFKDIVFKEPIFHIKERDLRVECRREK